MTIRDRDIARLCSAIYDHPVDDSVTWDHLDTGATDGICWGVKRIGDVDVIVFRGSVTIEDWLRDICGFADPFRHDHLGPVHPGFLLGLEQVWAEAKARLGPRVIVGGHSLGAGRAAILAGMMVLDMWSPVAIVTFGEPKPGFQKLADLVGGCVPGRVYCNGAGEQHDLVTDVPFSLPPEDYVHSRAMTIVHEAPSPAEKSGLGIFSFHHMRLYEAALMQDSPVIA